MYAEPQDVFSSLLCLGGFGGDYKQHKTSIPESGFALIVTIPSFDVKDLSSELANSGVKIRIEIC